MPRKSHVLAIDADDRTTKKERNRYFLVDRVARREKKGRKKGIPCFCQNPRTATNKGREEVKEKDLCERKMQ